MVGIRSGALEKLVSMANPAVARQAGMALLRLPRSTLGDGLRLALPIRDDHHHRFGSGIHRQSRLFAVHHDHALRPAAATVPVTWGWGWRAFGLLVLLATALFGALQLEFLCDDAFITFRYVSNAVSGHGLVWNPPPFLPVEGYTSFSWAMLLWAAWSWFGAEPPAIANSLSIAFGLLTVVVCAVATARIQLANGRRLPSLAVFVTLFVLVSNRCFLQWMTGGLETALFNLLIVSWVLLSFSPRLTSRRAGLATWTAIASLAALTRPDGLLLVAASAVCIVASVSLQRLRWSSGLFALLPTLLVATHVGWRFWQYGEWLPNTYYAKVTEAWPEAGLRYLYCFVFEHGLWLWAAVAAVWLAVMSFARGLLSIGKLGDRLASFAAVGAVAVHLSYYVLLVGGDHFEYRVFSYFVPLAVVSMSAMLAQLSPRSWVAIVGVGALGFVGSFAWLHLHLSRPTIPPDYDLLADKLPRWAEPLVRDYDRHQMWLQLQYNCIRCSTHELALANLRARLPERTQIASAPDDVPVTVGHAVGLLGWVLPNCNVIDVLGLNDWVVARSATARWGDVLPASVLELLQQAVDSSAHGSLTRAEVEAQFVRGLGIPPEQTRRLVDILMLLFADPETGTLGSDGVAASRQLLTGARRMAHDRQAPRDYERAFDANVIVADGDLSIRQRKQPLTPSRVRAIEAEWRRSARRGGKNR